MPGVVSTLEHAELQSNGFSTADKEQFVRVLEQTGFKPVEACRRAGISFTTYWMHYKHDERFRDMVEVARMLSAHKLIETSVTLGERKTAATFNDRKLQLQAFLPDYYRDRPLLDLSDGGQLTIAYLHASGNPCRPVTEMSDNVVSVNAEPTCEKSNQDSPGVCQDAPQQAIVKTHANQTGSTQRARGRHSVPKK